MEFDNVQIALAKLGGGSQGARKARPHPQSYRAHVEQMARQKPTLGEWLALKVEAVLRAVGLVAGAFRPFTSAMLAVPGRASAGMRAWWRATRPWR